MWKFPVWEKVCLVDQIVGRISLVQKKVLQFLGLRQAFKRANELIRCAPLLAVLHLGSFVSNWRQLPAQFPVSRATDGEFSYDDDDDDSGDDDDNGSEYTSDDISEHDPEANGDDDDDDDDD
mmetsp:Transcript_3476/g.6913  ORF Transcript_3476/g.6913 Transcript_3476/m.6913 type:complete len:122 (+) Transcript_3476:2946-3311(+)